MCALNDIFEKWGKKNLNSFSRKMLRNRRQSLSRDCEDETAVEQTGKMHKRAMKFKMSPYPEVKGVPLKESSHRLNQLAEVKTSLQFELSAQCSHNVSAPSIENRSSVDLSASRTKLDKSSIVKPTVEYVVPDTPKTMPSDRETKLGLFLPPHCEGGPSAEPTLKPSSVQHLERHMTPQYPRGSSHGNIGAGETPPASISSVWDSVVSWMKQAVDFVTVEADPTTPIPQHGKKRPHSDDISQSIPGSKVPKLTNQRATAGGRGVTRQSRRSSKRMSFGGYQTRPSEGLADLLLNKLPPITEATSPHSAKVSRIKSPTTLLATQFSHNLSVKSPQDMVTVSNVVNPSLFKFTAQKFQSTNDGLNTILDGSPAAIVPRMKKPRIRRQSLSQHYGCSVESPNLRIVPCELITVRRSPRLAQRSTPPMVVVPPPPPPPPLPHTPRAPPPPPTPKIPSMYDCDLNDTPSRTGVDQSRAMLQKMQSRLRTRMKKTAVGGPGDKGRGKQMDTVDIKTRQWAEIQALSRKISVPEFLAMVETKKKQTKRALEELHLNVPPTMAGISDTVQLLHDASQWFSGGVKEMRECLPLYRALEKKIDVLNEFTQLSSQIKDSCSSELPEGIHYSELHTALSHIRSEFNSKHRQWGPVVLSNAQSWQELGLPVCPQSILKAREYVCHLVEVFVKYSLMEASKIEGALLSLKCVRTKQVMDRLRECMQLIKDSHSYFQSSTTTDNCPGCDQCSPRASIDNSTPVNCLVPTLLEYILDVSLSYIKIALGQFEGFISKCKRQDVCEHFESMLKITNLVKSLVCDLHQTKPSRVKASGVICLIPKGEPLGNEIYLSCVVLIQHILSQTNSCVEQEISPRSQEKLSKEVILWMMFGCKYVHQTLEVLGSDKANARGVANLLNELQQMENLLPA